MPTRPELPRSVDAPAPGSAELVARLRQGDPAAFDAVYAAHRARVYAFLLRMTRDAALAHDLAQETWLRLAAHARQLTPETEPRAWLLRVARNLFISHRRWSIVQRAGLAALQFVRAPQAEANPHERAAGDAFERRVELALAALPLAQREVVLLVSVEGLSAIEAAAVLGLSPDAVRQRLSRGRAALKRTLERGAAAVDRDD